MRTISFDEEGAAEHLPPTAPALVLLWSRDEPERVGEVVLLPPGRSVLGRASPDPRAEPPVLGFLRQRPGRNFPSIGFSSPHISRAQIELDVEPERMLVRNVGRLPMRVRGEGVDEAELEEGDLVELAGQALLRVTTRPAVLPSEDATPARHPFGLADDDGLVGETPAVWALRERIRFVAARDRHVLVLGPSGAGKELVARAIHRQSRRGGRPLVSRSAATFPESLVDAELFGNARNYPNPGMAERAGLVGEADGGTLFLDEFAELPVSLQAHLLRVLDQGEYTRLGESRPRRSDFRLVAATNRPPEVLKDDLRARLPLRVDVPDLPARLDDIPLLVRHLLRRMRDGDPGSVARYLDARDEVRTTPDLVAWLVSYPWRLHLRELEGLLWEAIGVGHGPALDKPPNRTVTPSSARPNASAVDPATLTADEIRAALERNGGNQEKTWRDLGLASRHVLARLMRRHGLR